MLKIHITIANSGKCYVSPDPSDPFIDAAINLKKILAKCDPLKVMKILLTTVNTRAIVSRRTGLK